MKNMIIKKIITAIIFIFTVFYLPSLVSCDTASHGDKNDGGLVDDKDKNSGDSAIDGSDNDHTNPPQEANPKAVWGIGIKSRVIIKDDFTQDLDDLRTRLCADISFLSGSPAYPATDKIGVVEHEIVIGETSREISKAAYTVLEAMVDYKSEDGWLIYSEGNSFAIAYTSLAALDMAIEHFYETYMSIEELVFSRDGSQASYVFNLNERADTMRENTQSEQFNEIEKKYGKNTADALRQLYTLYSDDVYKWIAGLYDAEIGGFYFSNSGRDNVGYLPDIESTVQALNHLNSGSMFSHCGGYVYALSDEMKSKLLSFAKGLQSPDDGYFYHPQWGKNIIVARRGRDLGWATQLIKALGGTPYWNTPGGVIGENGAPGAVSASAFTSTLSLSSVISVSRVVASSSYLPDHLTSLDKWKDYIDGLNIFNDPYTSGNTLAAQHNEIKAAGDEYINYLTDYLTALQDPVTGFWGEGVTYVTMNGFMKLSHSYSYYGRTIPHAREALLSTVEILLTPDTDDRDLHVCNTYNTWVNFCQIFTSLKKVNGGEKTINELRALLLEHAPELIQVTYEKIKTHKRSEGGFSYFETKTCNASQKAPVACAITPESDVNATCISTTGIIVNLFSALGINKVPLYTNADADLFLRIIETKTPVVKNEPNIAYPTIDGERGNGKYFSLSNKYDTIAAPPLTTASASAYLSKTEDKYVYFYKDVTNGENNSTDSINHMLPSSKPKDASGIVFELDIAFGGFSNRTYDGNYAGFQINIYDGVEYASVYFNFENGKIGTQWGSIIDGNAILLDENRWYNLRLESYEYESTRAVKIYVNGTYSCTVKSADDKATTSNYAATILRQFETDDWVAFDNVYVGYYSE